MGLALAIAAVLVEIFWLAVFLLMYTSVGGCFTCSEGGAWVAALYLPAWLMAEVPLGLMGIIGAAYLIRRVLPT